MGGSSSKAVAQMTMDAVATVSTNVINDNKSIMIQQNTVSVGDVDGSVIINGATQTTKATLNVNAYLKALTSNDVQQKLAANIAQKAKALTKGINLMNFSDAETNLDLFMSASMTVTNKIKQKCQAQLSQSNLFKYGNVKGDFTINDFKQSAIGEVVQKCIQDAVTNTTALQKVQAAVSQVAVSKTVGFSIWALVALLLLILGAPVVALSVGAEKVFSFMMRLMPILLIAGGIAMIIVRQNIQSPTMDGTGFALFDDPANQVCFVGEGSTTTKWKKNSAAAEACNEDPSCRAFQFKAYTVGAGNLPTPIPPVTTFYKDIGNPDCSVAQDDVGMRAKPTLTVGSKPDNPKPGDVWVDGTRGSDDVKIRNASGSWDVKGSVASLANGSNDDTVTMGSPPWGAQSNVIYIFFESDDPYVTIQHGSEKRRQNFPGVQSKTPSPFNAVGIKIDKPVGWLTPVGIGMITLGILAGSVIVYRMRRPRQP